MSGPQLAVTRCYQNMLEALKALLACWNLREPDCSFNKEAAKLKGYKVSTESC